MITLNLNPFKGLHRDSFDEFQWNRIQQSTFEELWNESEPTLQPGVSYHRYCGLWLERSGTVKLSAVDTYPEDNGRLMREIP